MVYPLPTLFRLQSRANPDLYYHAWYDFPSGHPGWQSGVVELEANYVCAGDDPGHVTIRQNGARMPLCDVSNVQTRYPDGDCEGNIDNSSSSTAAIYVHAAICSGNRRR